MRLLYSIFVLFMLQATTWGQSGVQVLVVNAATGARLPDQTVVLHRPDTGFQITATSDADGLARIDGLQAGRDYELRIADDSLYQTTTISGIDLRANANRSLTAYRFPIREVELEEITVTASPGYAQINAVDAEVAFTLPARELEVLPVEGRDLSRALYRLPNVTRATGFYPEAPNVSINGANSLFSNYMIEGLDNNENFLGGQKFRIPMGMVQDVSVLTSAYSAEFGRTANGVINVTMRSGGNTNKGEVYYQLRPGPVLDASSPFAQRDLSGNAVKDGFQRHQGGFSIGGPIQTDRTFYFFNLEQTISVKDNLLQSPRLGINETVRGENFLSQASLKLDHRWNDRLRSTLRGHLGREQIERQGGGLDGGVQFPSAGSVQTRNALLLAGQTTYVSGRFVSESSLQYSRFDWNYARALAESGRPRIALYGADGLPVAQIGHPGFVFDEREQTFQLQQKFNYAAGRHSLKAGIDLLSADFSLNGGGNPNGTYQVNLTEAEEETIRAQNHGADLTADDLPANLDVTAYSVELRPAAFGDRQNLLGIYAEDHFKAARGLNLTLGLRYDYDSISKGGSTSGDWNNLAPRFGFNYRLNDKNVIKGGYGMFYEKVVYAVHSDALQQNSTSTAFKNQLRSLIDAGRLPADTDIDRVTFDGNLAASFINPSFGLLEGPSSASLQDQREQVTRNDGRILNPEGYDNPYAHQVSVGYQRQLGPTMRFYADFVRSWSFNLLRLRDLNAPSPYKITPEEVAAADDPASLIRSREEADATRPAGVVPGGARNIIVSESAGKARYAAANFNLFKERGDNPYSWRISYTLSRLQNNTDDINFRAQNANDFEAEWGPSVNDRTHVINMLGVFYPSRSSWISLSALLQSGQPINRIPDATVFGTTDLNGDGRSFGDAYVGNSDRHPGASRNSDRLPWSYLIDLSAGHAIPIGADEIALRAGIFNLLNTVNLSGYSNNATQSNQIQTGPVDGPIVKRNAGPPRQFQFGVSYVF